MIVPLRVVSDKAEYAARTIRPKLHRHLAAYLTEFKPATVKKSSLNLDINGIEIDDIEAVLGKLKLDRSVPPVTGFFKGGSSRARQMFKSFLHRRLRNAIVPKPNNTNTVEVGSGMSVIRAPLSVTSVTVVPVRDRTRP